MGIFYWLPTAIYPHFCKMGIFFIFKMCNFGLVGVFNKHLANEWQNRVWIINFLYIEMPALKRGFFLAPRGHISPFQKWEFENLLNSINLQRKVFSKMFYDEMCL